VSRILSSLCFALPVVLCAACEPPPPDEPPPPPVVLETPYEVNPATCDAGRVSVDAVGTCDITVTNVSDVDVNVTGATSGPPFIAIGAVGTLAPGDSLVVTVNALPRVEGVVTGELSLGPGRLVVPLVVEGVLSSIVVVVAATPEDAVVGDTVTLDASASLPADADSFTWALSSLPAGSAAVLSTTNEAVTTFVADVAGFYEANVTITAGDQERTEGLLLGVRDARDLALTTSAGVLHLRRVGGDVDDSLCGPLDCFAGSCTDVAWGGPRATPTSAGGGILVDDLAEGTYRATLVLPVDGTAGDATVSAFQGGALLGEHTVALTPGDAVDVVDVVVTIDGVTLVEVNETIVGGACPSGTP
jgi:hypothetical protein